MALGLDDLSSKAQSRSQIHNTLRQTKRPWQAADQVNEIATDRAEAVALEAPIPGYADIARTAVERARAIVERNDAMLNEIYSRRLGRDMRTMEESAVWGKIDEQLFYLQDFSWEVPQVKQDGVLTKLRKLFSPRH